MGQQLKERIFDLFTPPAADPEVTAQISEPPPVPTLIPPLVAAQKAPTQKPKPAPATAPEAAKPAVAAPATALEAAKPAAADPQGILDCGTVEDKDMKELFEALKKGRHVIVFRHEAKINPPSPEKAEVLEGCEKPKESLTLTGRSNSVMIGKNIRTTGIPVGTVRTSEYCRTVQTAKHAFSKGTSIRALNLDDPAKGFLQAVVRYQLEVLANEKSPNNTVLVTHSENLDKFIAGESIQEGESAVIALDDKREPRCLVRMKWY